MTKTITMTGTDHIRVTDAVAEAERGTDGEIVTIVNLTSDSYHDAGLHGAIAALFAFFSSLAIFPAFYRNLATAISGGWEQDYSMSQWLTMILVASIVIFLAFRYLFAISALRMAITPQSTKNRRVRRKAIAFFKVGAEKRTVGLTGILIYLSLRERRAEIVADEAITAKVAPEVWGDAMDAMIAEVKAGRPGEGMAAAVEQIGVILAEHFPKSLDNRNELPDRLIEL